MTQTPNSPADAGAHYSIEGHCGYEKDGITEWAVWDEESDFPEPCFEAASREECEAWIARATLGETGE